jgi:predicted AlkP superfamily pyrophosphatase or phosphodiesterase
MPRLVNAVPKYRKHRASVQALVTINYADHYLGPDNSKASVALYDRLIAEYLASGRQAARKQLPEQGMVVVQVLAAYWKHCKSYYLKHEKADQGASARRA